MERKDESSALEELLSQKTNFEAINSFIDDKNVKINYLYVNKDSDDTFMHYAARLPKPLRIFKILYERGARVNVKNKKQETPLDLLDEKKFPKAGSYLKTKIEEEKRIVKLEVEEVLQKKILDEIKNQGKVHPGIYFISNLELSYRGKYPNRICEIPDQWFELDHQDYIENLTLHQRLAITEAFVTSSAHDINLLSEDSLPSTKSANFVTANIGFIVSNKAWKFRKEDDYRLEFITIPIDDAAHDIFRPEDNEPGTHAESIFYEYIKKINTQRKIACILTENLLKRFRSADRHKIYATILDMHTSLDMCTTCEEKTYKIQQDRSAGSFLKNLEDVLESEFNFILPKEKNDPNKLLLPKSKRMQCVTRVSSYLKYRRGVQPSQMVKNYPYFYKNFNLPPSIRLLDKKKSHVLQDYDLLSNKYCVIRECDEGNKINWSFVYKDYNRKEKELQITPDFKKLLDNLEKPFNQLAVDKKTEIRKFITKSIEEANLPAAEPLHEENKNNIKNFDNSVILHTDSDSRKNYYFYGKDEDKYKNLINSKEKYPKTFIALSRQTVFSTVNKQTSPHSKEVPQIEIKFSQ